MSLKLWNRRRWSNSMPPNSRSTYYAALSELPKNLGCWGSLCLQVLSVPIPSSPLLSPLKTRSWCCGDDPHLWAALPGLPGCDITLEAIVSNLPLKSQDGTNMVDFTGGFPTNRALFNSKVFIFGNLARPHPNFELLAPILAIFTPIGEEFSVFLTLNGLWK